MYGVRVFGGSAISPVGLNTPRGYGYFARWAQYASRLRLFRPLGSIRLRGYGYFARWAQYASAVCPTPCPRPTGRGWAQTAPRRRRIQTPRGGIHQTAPRRRRIQNPRGGNGRELRLGGAESKPHVIRVNRCVIRANRRVMRANREKTINTEN